MKQLSDFFLVFRQERQTVSPVIGQVYLELSTHCNLSCAGCVRNSIIGLKKTHFSPVLMKKLLPELRALMPERIVLLGFGEALCSPYIKSHLKALRTLDTRLVLVTNAAFLDEAMSSMLVSLPVDEVYVSWDDDIGGSDAVLRRGIQAADFRNNIEQLARIISSSTRSLPALGMEIVARKNNLNHIARTVEYGRSIGVERFIITNLFPYSAAMQREILYETRGRPAVDLRRMLKRHSRAGGIRIAAQSADKSRRCPFVEKGTLFITAQGEVAPCPEMAYTHPAHYFGYERLHSRYIVGNARQRPLAGIWEDPAFSGWRKNFLYYDYPDCAHCYRPDLCYKRTVEDVDCYLNATPCGECLWAKEIIICP
jgi:MoaA/NifB/PqqE/SkfB family radical SAM enzyme